MQLDNIKTKIKEDIKEVFNDIRKISMDILNKIPM